METDAPIACARPVGCALGFKYLAVDASLSLVLELAQDRHLGRSIDAFFNPCAITRPVMPSKSVVSHSILTQ
jgi:hypothetical protein